MTTDNADDLELLVNPQHTEPATHTVLTTLREMIVTGKIPPDTRLRAEALATQLDVSRTPIRSALAVLSAEGLIGYSVNRGYTVRAVSIRDVFDSIDVRAPLEAMACQISVDHGWIDADLERLADVVARSRAIVARGAWSEAIEREWYEFNFLFHRTIHRASHNSALRNAIRMTLIYPLFGDVVRVCPIVAEHVPQRLRRLSTTVPAHILQSQTEHEAMLEAMRAGDSNEAARLMSGHVLATKARVQAIATFR